MIVSTDTLLEILPPFNNNSVLIEKNQEVHDIVKEVIEAHKYFGQDYDFIYQFFDTGSIQEVCKNLFDFCKQNIEYKIESEDKQTTKSPAAIIAMGEGDCKHYAGFIAGVLSAIMRNTGRKINWSYRFASYSVFDEDVQHVFVIVNDKGTEIWIDPVLCCFNIRSPFPVRTIDKKININLMLTRVSGIGLLAPLETSSRPVEYGDKYVQYNAATQHVILPTDVIEEDDYYSQDVPADVVENIKMLLYYGVIDSTLNIRSDVYLDIVSQLAPGDADALSQAYGNFLHQAQGAAIGDIFSSIWGTVKQVSLAPMRGAYLALVSLNVFNLAGHLIKCITHTDGSTDQPGIDKLQNIWHQKLAGDTNLLLRAIRNGATKKAILGIGVVPVVAAAWATTAATIIVAMTPIIKQILQSKNQLDSTALSQLNMQPISTTSTLGSSSLTKYLPYILIGGVGLYLYLDKKKK